MFRGYEQIVALSMTVKVKGKKEENNDSKS